MLALVLTILSPAIWVNILGQEAAIFPYSSPAIFSMPIAFFTIWLVSLLDRSPRAGIDRAGYLHQRIRAETGIGAAEVITALKQAARSPQAASAAGRISRARLSLSPTISTNGQNRVLTMSGKLSSQRQLP